jgi:hypothetical protein
MFKFIIVFAGLFLSIHLQAQTGIGTTTPHTSAKLDVSASNKGFLPPRVTLTSNTDATTIPSPAEGLLVYNIGSVGLQAGYYYWNNANWATIATATSAGNGVTASDMVKIYDGVGNAATINVNGATFSVTTSGKYLFDFSTSATCSNCTVTLNFQVRDGSNSNAVIGSDYQTSYNNNVHAEYNGKVEVNLIAGRSYNVLVTASSGGIYNNDYTRVYMKQVSGNLPVTGQSVDYVSVSTISQSSIGDNRDLIFTTNNGGNIPYNTSTGVFTLSANKTYLFQAQIRSNLPSASGNYIEYGFVDATSNTLLVNGTQTITSSTTSTSGFGSNPVINFIYTPTSNQTVKLRTTATTVGTQNIVSGTANITQIGSSAIINPWTLSGTNTYNTTGNVGIGNTAPTAKLDVTGSLGVSGSGTFRTIGGDEGGEIEFGVPQTNTTLSTRVVTDVWQNRYRIFDGNTKGVYIDLSKAPTGVGGELLTKASGFVNAGDYVTLGNIKARIPTSGNRSLQVATVSGTYSVYGSGVHVFSSNVGSTTIDGGSPRSISTTPAYLNSGNTFATAGGTDTWNIMDTTNFIGWRISCIIGGGYFANLITIERLF